MTASICAAAQIAPTPASACAGCHAAQTLHQAETPMGRAMLLPGENPTLKAHPTLTVQKGSYTYTIETQADKSTYSVSDGAKTVSLPIRWTFGQGMQTWVFERNGRYYESLVSYYPSIQGLDTTMGDEGLTPRSIDEGIGRELKGSDVKNCFGCHSTNSVSKNQLTLDSLQPGVTCEHCHAGTSTHLVDALQGVFDSAPPTLKALPSEDISNFCGQCHRSWEMVVRGHTQGVVNVRFQPYRLANSKCFDGADPRISCIACHDPHQNVLRDDTAYDGKCLACHTTKSSSKERVQASASAQPVAHPEAEACPVANANCASCHMPKVKLPGGLITFTDHQIRVVKAGEEYPN